MTEHQDPVLQNLFAVKQTVQDEKDAQVFTDGVMARTRRLVYKVVAGLAAVFVVLLLCIWVFAIPLQEVVQLVTQTVSATLFDLGDSWVSWVFAPVNNIASLIVISLKAVRLIHKRILRASFTA